MREAPQHNITIIGGGIIGLSSALALAKNNSELTIALIDAGEPPQKSFSIDQQDKLTYDLRVSAVTRASQKFLQNLNVWDQIISQRTTPYKHMHVWDATGKGEIHFDSADIGEPNLGFIIENNIIQSALHTELSKQENIKFYYASKPKSINETNSHLTLNFETTSQPESSISDHQHHQLQTNLIIGADGANSWLRSTTNIPLQKRPYNHNAIVATIKTELPHQQTAWQRFLPTGPLAFLPLADPNHCSIVWSTTPDQAKHLTSISSNEFNATLAISLEHKLGDTQLVSDRIAFPLFMRHAERYIANRIALIGDAAHTIHPLAGQGMNLGLLDAAALAEVITTAHQKRREYFAIHTLRRYERWRKGANQQMIYTMDGFRLLFGNENPFLTQIRNLGLNLIDKAPPIKNHLIQRAMGLTGDLPDLAKPS